MIVHLFILVACSICLGACSQKAQEPLHSMAPRPLPRMGTGSSADGGTLEDSEAPFQVEDAPIWGSKIPEGAKVLRADRAGVHILGQVADPATAEGSRAIRAVLAASHRVLLQTDEEGFLAEQASLLALIDDQKSELWLQHPASPVAFKVLLRSERSFQTWLDEAVPGKIRIIQRADGFELQTNIGKMAGSDPNGPTIPVRGGKLDIARLRRGLSLLNDRFGGVRDSCLVPSFGTELSQIARALSGFYSGPGKRIVDELCLVYPRPGP